MRFDLSDEEWALLVPLLPKNRKSARVDDYLRKSSTATAPQMPGVHGLQRLTPSENQMFRPEPGNLEFLAPGDRFWGQIRPGTARHCRAPIQCPHNGHEAYRC
jgi:hypothetical protein